MDEGHRHGIDVFRVDSERFSRIFNLKFLHSQSFLERHAVAEVLFVEPNRRTGFNLTIGQSALILLRTKESFAVE